MAESKRPTLQVFTFKEGMLARLGHDLRLSAHNFDVSVDRGKIKARVELSSLTVDGALKDGVLDAHELSDSDREKILTHAREDVLHVARGSDALFEGEAREEKPGNFGITGNLTLHERTRPLRAKATVQGRRIVVSSELKPSDWDIKPFRALAGAIRVQDRVRVELSAELMDGVDAEHLLETNLTFSST